MSLNYKKIREGLSIDNAFYLLEGTIDPSSVGLAAPVGSQYNRNVGGTAAEVYIKTSAADTAWDISYSSALGSGEDGYQNTFMGKTAGGGGNENPSYSSTNVVSGSLTNAIGQIDAEIGAAISAPNSRNAEYSISDQAINLNLQAIDEALGANQTYVTRTNGQLSNDNPVLDLIGTIDVAIGANSEMTNTNYISTANTLYENLSALDGQANALDTEDGYIRTFIGKTGAGSETPSYTSNTLITDGDNLEVAAGKLDAGINAHIIDSSAAHAATAISNTPAGNIAATNVQAALNELDTEKLALSGGTMTGTLVMGANKITSSYTPIDGVDLANKTYVDSLVSGISWKLPVEAFNVISETGSTSVAVDIDGLSPSIGDQYISLVAGTPAATGSDTVAVGDIIEYQGGSTGWQVIVANSGGFVPAGTRIIVTNGTAATPFTDATDNDKILEAQGDPGGGTYEIEGTASAFNDTGDAVDKNSVLVQDEGHISVYDNIAYVYEGVVAGGTWVQFTGAGQIVAGNAIDITAQTISVKYDDSTIGTNGSNQLEVKASGIGETELNNVDGGVDAQSFVLTSGYTPGTGNPAAADTIEAALQKIDGNVDALNSLTGEVQGGTTYSSFTPGTGNPAAGDTIKEVLQKIDGNVDALNTATGIAQGVTDLTGIDVATNGTVSSVDTVKSAIGKLAANTVDLTTLTGVAQGAVNLGDNFSNILTSSETVLTAAQKLEAEIEKTYSVTTASSVTTATTIDEVLVDDVSFARWIVHCYEVANPANKYAIIINAIHDGTAAADATAVDSNGEFLNLNTAIDGLTIDVDLNGSSTTQTMRLRVTSTDAVNVSATRLELA